MRLVGEFKEFALRGNVIDLAIGVVIGAAFGKIVDAFVNDILMPPLGVLTGGRDFSNLFITLGRGTFATLAEARAAGVATLNYGLFLNAVIDFLIIAFAIFLVVKRINAWKRKPEAAEAAALRPCPECLSEIPLGARRCRFCTAAV